MIRNLGTADKPSFEVRVSKRIFGRVLGKRKRGILTLREAKQVERQLHIDLVRDAAEGVAPTLTWGEVVEQWAADPETHSTYSPGTLERYTYALEKGVTREWGLKDICSLTRQDTLNFLDTYCKARNLSQNTKSYQKKLISTIFRYAQNRGFLASNPAETIRIKESRAELNIWTKDQLETFLAGVKKVDVVWWRVFAIAVMTGMRAGELTALKWKNVNFEDNLIRVCESYDWRTGEDRPTTKNRTIRNVPINQVLKGVLGDKGDKYVLPRLYELLHGEGAKVLKRFATVIGVPPIRFHDLRAIFACQMAMSGVPIHIIKAIAGWADLSVVARYMRISGSEVRGMTDNLEIKI